MDRNIVYAGQIPLSGQFLKGEQNKMVSLGFAMEAILGASVIVDGLACTPTAPASLAVQIGRGSIYQLASLEASSFGSLPLDVARNIVKQGVNKDVTTFTLNPPDTIGQSVIYIIQAALSETDADPVVLPYVNSADPSQPFTGPNNSGASQNTTRKTVVALSAKSGISATTGTEVAPAADPGYTPLYQITVPQGATTLSGANITRAPDAPFLDVKLPEVPEWVQRGEYAWGIDTGTANAVVVSLDPVPDAYVPPLPMFVRKMNAANTGGMTINVNGLGVIPLLNASGSSLASGAVPAGFLMAIVYDGTACRLINGSVSITNVSDINASSGEGIEVLLDETVNLNFPGLVSGSPTSLDLLAFHDNEDDEHKVINWAALLSLIAASLPGGVVNLQFFTASGTYTKTPGAKRALVIAHGPGGGGGGHATYNSGGGGAGGADISLIDLTAISTVAITIGNPGVGGVGGNNGGNGGNTTFGDLLRATGGRGGSTDQGMAALDAKGGVGGVGELGLIRIRGNPGGSSTGGGHGSGGTGGAGLFGGAGIGGNASLPGQALDNGQSGSLGAGGGGSDGGSQIGTGGAGGPGWVFILEFA